MTKHKIMVVDDEDLLRWSIKTKLEQWGYDVVEGETASQALQRFEEESPALVILDIKLPDGSGIDVLKRFKEHDPEAVVIIITAQTTVDNAVAALRLGAFDFICKPINYAELEAAVRNGLETSHLRDTLHRVQSFQKKRFSFDMIVGESPKMRELMEIVKRVAESEATCVVLQGESGVGKDLVAKAIHYQSRRAEYPYVAVNCAAIPETLMETELFGHEKGAFTDARAQKKGVFELATGGTILLDEIGDLPLGLQAKLLRVIEEQQFRRIGGVKNVSVDVRILASSNRDLEEEVRVGHFRADLFYRLSVVQITIPPLRERKEDILLIADHLIKHFNVKMKKNLQGLAPETRKLFLEYHWPGNVRELRNTIEHAMIFEESPHITHHHLHERIVRPTVEPISGGRKASVANALGNLTLEEIERDLINQSLERTNWNKTQAAQLLGISRDAIRYKIKKYKLHRREAAASTG
jgi:DNA-binding NtrC family response regulator